MTSCDHEDANDSTFLSSKGALKLSCTPDCL
jgi:hypothetical protein